MINAKLELQTTVKTANGCALNLKVPLVAKALDAIFCCFSMKIGRDHAFVFS